MLMLMLVVIIMMIIQSRDKLDRMRLAHWPQRWPTRTTDARNITA